MPITVISSIELRRLFQTDTEFAVIDTREAGDFSKGHLLCASNLPLSRLPLLIDLAMPNKNTLIVITNSADDGADRSMATLRELGYKNLHRLSGGIAGWKQSGGEIFSGVNVPGKAFGEFIEHQNSTPSITAEQLAKLLQSDKKVHLLDSRTPEEHVAYCIPGATGCPGGELVLRAGEIFADSDEDAIAVVHCAGRTRSIIGAQTLINAGAVMPVYALENGTLAWQFAHLDLQINNTHHLQQPNQQELQKARVRAHALVQGLDIGEISFDELLAVKPEQTCYRFDIRSAAEFQQGHLKDFRHVAGGQLVQNVDDYLVTRNCQIVLADSEGVRALSTASWLWQMGYRNLSTIRIDRIDEKHIRPPEFKSEVALEPALTSTQTLDKIKVENLLIVDIRSSLGFRHSHIAGSWFLHRGNIVQDVKQLPSNDGIILFSDNSHYAQLVATDLHRMGHQVSHLTEGIDSWIAAGGSIDSGFDNMASDTNDLMLNPDDYDDPHLAEQEGRRYLQWEIELINQLPGDPAAIYMNP